MSFLVWVEVAEGTGGVLREAHGDLGGGHSPKGTESWEGGKIPYNHAAEILDHKLHVHVPGA